MRPLITMSDDESSGRPMGAPGGRGGGGAAGGLGRGMTWPREAAATGTSENDSKSSSTGFPSSRAATHPSHRVPLREGWPPGAALVGVLVRLLSHK